MKTNLVSHAVRYALIAGAVAAVTAPAVFAQDADQANASAQNQSQNGQNVSLKKIMVTGSLIPRTSIETAAPVTVITAKQIQESGLTNVGAVIRTLSSDNSGTVPMAFTNGFANGSIGVALRGLDVNSTLVLIDGHRVAAYGLQDDGIRTFSDLASIPMNAVERIEVLKDGASSIYGADAIAGVINIILYPSWTGSKATAQVGTSQHGGGTQTSATFITGVGNLDTNNYNAYMSFEYEEDQPIWNRDRKSPLDSCDPPGLANECVGGAAITPSIYGAEAPAIVTRTNADGGPDLLSGDQVGPLANPGFPGTSFEPIRACPTPVTFAGTGPGTGTGCSYNQVALYNQIQPQTTRYGLDSRITVNFTPTTTGYVNVMYDQVRMVSNSGLPASAGGPVPSSGPPQITNLSPVNTTNIVLPPMLPGGGLNPNDIFAKDCTGQTAPGPAPGVYDPTCPYALIDYTFGPLPGFGWETDVNHNLRAVASLNGAISENWNYNTALTLEHTWLDINNFGYLNIPQLEQDVTDGTYNFIDPSQNSQQVLSTISPPIHKVATTNLDEWDGSINGTIAELPGGPLGLAFGAQWRYESIDNPELNPGNEALGLGSAQTFGQHNVAALFGEMDVPLLPSLEVDVSGREDHYSDFGSAFSPKVGIKWTPTQQLMFRGTYSRGFRAPGFAENGSSSSLGFTTFTPPQSFIDEHCAAGSSPPGCKPDPYAQSFQIALLNAANPNIKPERSRNYTLGMVFQPFSSFSGTVDYYNILKTNLIAPPATAALLSAFFAGSPLPPGSVILDVPDPLHPTSPARPTQFNGFYVNENELRTSGFDVNLRYTLNAATLTWTTNFNGTKIETWCETLVSDGPCVNMVGTQGPYNLSSGAGTPKFRWNWANTFTFGPVSITDTVYWVSGMYMSAPDLFGPSCISKGTNGQQVPANCETPAFWYMDLTGQWNITNNWALTAGILNATDRSPPFDPIDYAGNYYNPTYAQQGAVGRFYQVGLQVKF